VTAVALALGAGFVLGGVDFLAGLISRRIAASVVLLAGQAISVVLTGVLIASLGMPPPGTDQIVYGLLAGLALAVGLGALYKGLAIGPMSIVSPLAATSAAVPVFAGLASGERPSTAQAVGIVAALAGVLTLSVPASGGTGGGRPMKLDTSLRTTLPGIAMAGVAAVASGCFVVGLDAATADDDVLWGLVLARGGAVVVVAIAVALMRPGVSAARERKGALLVVGMLETVGGLMLAAATTLGLISIVGVLISLYPLVTIALARVLLGERLSIGQRWGVVVVLTGVALMTVG
jgi:drug/metabolite transporter (DMT)-like permease